MFSEQSVQAFQRIFRALFLKQMQMDLIRLRLDHLFQRNDGFDTDRCGGIFFVAAPDIPGDKNRDFRDQQFLEVIVCLAEHHALNSSFQVFDLNDGKRLVAFFTDLFRDGFDKTAENDAIVRGSVFLNGKRIHGGVGIEEMRILLRRMSGNVESEQCFFHFQQFRRINFRNIRHVDRIEFLLFSAAEKIEQGTLSAFLVLAA